MSEDHVFVLPLFFPTGSEGADFSCTSPFRPKASPVSHPPFELRLSCKLGGALYVEYVKKNCSVNKGIRKLHFKLGSI